MSQKVAKTIAIGFFAFSLLALTAVKAWNDYKSYPSRKALQEKYDRVMAESEALDDTVTE